MSRSMPQIAVHVAIEIDAPAASVWKILGGFDGLPAISSSTVASRLEEEGRVRVLTGRSGGTLWERLIQFDEEKRILAYEITDAKQCNGLAYGVGYRGKVQVLARRGGRSSTFVYRARFKPSGGVSKREARRAVVAFAEDCADGVRRVLRRPV